jgi:hypothetical protein
MGTNEHGIRKNRNRCPALKCGAMIVLIWKHPQKTAGRFFAEWVAAIRILSGGDFKSPEG